MLVYDRSWAWPNIQRGILRRGAEKLNSIDLKQPGEMLWRQFSSDGFALSVLFYSAQPQQMLERIEKTVFPAFGPQQLVSEEWLYRVTFRLL